jgi:hypothetical protein
MTDDIAALREEWETGKLSGGLTLPRPLKAAAHPQIEQFVERLFARAEAAERERDEWKNRAKVEGHRAEVERQGYDALQGRVAELEKENNRLRHMADFSLDAENGQGGAGCARRRGDWP